MILDIMDAFYEQFQVWLASIEPVPEANDNPGPRNDGWSA